MAPRSPRTTQSSRTSGSRQSGTTRAKQTLDETIAALPGANLVLSLQQVTDALVPAIPIDVATVRLLDAAAELQLVAASGLRPDEIRRLALEPIPARRHDTMVEAGRLSLLGALGLHSVEVRWLTAGDAGIGTLTVGARTDRRLSDGDLALLDAAAAQLGHALEPIERSPASSATAPCRWLG